MFDPVVGQFRSNGEAPYIREVAVRGFKSIRDECVARIAPLTILAGANSSGKSSLLQPLLLLKQTLEASYDPGSLLLSGTNVKFSTADQVLAHGKSRETDSAASFNVRISFANSLLESLELQFRPDASKGLQTSLMRAKFGEVQVEVTPAIRGDKLAAIVESLFKIAESSLFAQYSRQFSLTWEVVRERCYLIPRSYEKNSKVPTFVATPLSGAAELVSSTLTSLVHLPGLRGNPERAYPVTAVGAKFQGSFDQYAASVIASWQDKNRRTLLTSLSDELRRLELTWKIQAKRINATQVELRVGRTSKPAQGGASDLVNIVDVGFGLSQSLPVLVALIAAQRGDIVYVEQPEIHLHPRAQYGLAETVAKAAARGVRVVVETHSSLFLLGIQTLIAEQQVSRDDVALHWLSRNADGFTRISTAEIGEDGSFGEWPADFDDVTLSSQQRYVDAASEVPVA